jgi:glycerol-3-phosphate acyltransferase PlsX
MLSEKVKSAADSFSRSARHSARHPHPSTRAFSNGGELITIALDAMGSDKSPGPELDGAILACRSLPVRIMLVGPQERLMEGLAARPSARDLPIKVVHASEWITMDDKAATAIRSKRDNSMRVGCKLVREGRAAGFMTAGNTGAAMATSKMVLGMIKGVDRPALTAVLPTATGNPCIFLDVGANVDCKPNNLLQFAIMGEMYARSVLGITRPRVGLLSVGEEEGKGNALTKESYPLLQEAGLNFIGNVEGRDLYNGSVDVVVADGFVGNVALKTSEGLARMVRDLLRESLKSTITAQVGALLSRAAFIDFKKRLDYSEYGGVPLLGINGACIIGHGSSNARAIFNAIRVTAQFAKSGTNHAITDIFSDSEKLSSAVTD